MSIVPRRPRCHAEICGGASGAVTESDSSLLLSEEVSISVDVYRSLSAAAMMENPDLDEYDNSVP